MEGAQVLVRDMSAESDSSSSKLLRLFFKEPNLAVPKGTNLGVLSPDFKSGHYFDQAVHIETTSSSVLLFNEEFETSPIKERLQRTFDFLASSSTS
jgi:hypothetical protein